MVAAILRRGRAREGVRPFDPYRDSKQVAELITVAFRGRLGPGGEVALAEMRRVARWGPLLWWFYWPGWEGAGFTPGFVWVEQGRVVGNVSLRRALGWGAFFVGNVAVHPDWQNRGIASALMEAALAAISVQGGCWVGLEVRSDNQVARRIYERLGFREAGETLQMLRPAGLPWSEDVDSCPGLRRGRSSDGKALIDLVHLIVPEPQRSLLELRRKNYVPSRRYALDFWLEGRRETWWVVEKESVICGAVRALCQRGQRPDRLEILVSPTCDERFETLLVQQGIASLQDSAAKAIEITLPNANAAVVAALEAFGFEKARVLVQMRLNLA